MWSSRTPSKACRCQVANVWAEARTLHKSELQLSGAFDQELMGGNAGGSAHHEVCFYGAKLEPCRRKHVRHDVVLDRVAGAGEEDSVTKPNQIGEEDQLGVVDLDGVRDRNAQSGSGVAQQLD